MRLKTFFVVANSRGSLLIDGLGASNRPEKFARVCSQGSLSIPRTVGPVLCLEVAGY